MPATLREPDIRFANSRLRAGAWGWAGGGPRQEKEPVRTGRVIYARARNASDTD